MVNEMKMNFLSLSLSVTILFSVISSLVDGRAINRHQQDRISGSNMAGHEYTSYMEPYMSNADLGTIFQSMTGHHGESGHGSGRGGRGHGGGGRGERGDRGRYHHKHRDHSDSEFEDRLRHQLRNYLSGSRARNQHTFRHGVNRYSSNGGVM